ncbi:MAG: beta-galactosidase [Terriglobia bacterium]
MGTPHLHTTLALLACLLILPNHSPGTDGAKNLAALFSREGVSKVWKTLHCDLAPDPTGTLRATFWKGYETTGFETTSLPLTDWSAWKSLKFEVTNLYPEPFSVYVRISDQPDHPGDRTYTGGTFDGFVMSPGRNTVELSLEDMRSPDDQLVDAKRIAYLGVFFNPLFLRDGQDLKFSEDKAFRLSDLRLETASARLQKQPYAGPLFGEMSPTLAARRKLVERAITELRKTIQEAQARGIDTAYAEIYPFLADVTFQKRLVAFWQNRTHTQRETLDFLLRESRGATAELREVLDGKRQAIGAPPVPAYSELQVRNGYFRLGEEPKLIFGMLYNREGPLLRWFANSQTDYGTQLVAGGTRHDVERQPIWQAYQRYPDTHRVGWDNADHIIRDRGSWEVLGPPVNVCLESPRSRAAVAEMIDNFGRTHAGDRTHLVLNMGYEYTYVCYCDFTRQMWFAWLRRKYPSVAEANRVWQTDYADFTQVPMPRPESATNRALWFDWASFNLYRFLEQIRWTRDQIRRTEPSKPLTVGSPYFAFSPSLWTAVDEEELADSDITGVVLEENYHLDSLQPEYLHALAGPKPVVDFEHHGVVHQILPSFLHGDAAVSVWWWNDQKRWTPNEPINEWPSSFPQSYTIPLQDVAKAMRDALDLRRLGPEIAALGSAPRPIVLLYSKTSMLQHPPEDSGDADVFPYLFYLRHLYNASQSVGAYVGLTTEKKILAGDLKNRKVLVVPAAEFVPERVTAEILSWVEHGGTLVVSPDSLLADEYARPTNVLQTLGLRLVDREPPKLKHGEKTVTEYNLADLPRMPFVLAQSDVSAGRPLRLQAAGGRQIIECAPDLVAAKLSDGSPALIHIRKGAGSIYWLAAPLLPESWGRFLGLVSSRAGVNPGLGVYGLQGESLPDLEFRVTEHGGGHLVYFYNNSDQSLRFLWRASFPHSRVIDRRTETVLSGRTVVLPPRETAILEFR